MGHFNSGKIGCSNWTYAKRFKRVLVMCDRNIFCDFHDVSVLFQYRVVQDRSLVADFYPNVEK